MVGICAGDNPGLFCFLLGRAERFEPFLLLTPPEGRLRVPKKLGEAQPESQLIPADPRDIPDHMKSYLAGGRRKRGNTLSDGFCHLKSLCQ